MSGGFSRPAGRHSLRDAGDRIFNGGLIHDRLIGMERPLLIQDTTEGEWL